MDENEPKINIKSPDEVTLDEKSFEKPEVSETTVSDPAVREPAPVATEPIVPEPSVEMPEEKPSHKSRNIFISILALVIVSLGAFTAVAMINRNSGSDEPKNSEKEKEEPEPIKESLKLSGNQLSDFDLEFLKLENESKNKIYSPLSIKYALAMLKDGATGDSKTQIENLIGNYTPKAYINSENRSLANAMAINETYKEQILPNYVSSLQANYNAEVIYDPFANPLAINQWVSDKTLGRIENLLEDDFNRENNVMFLLINALAIDMEWNNKIQCSDTVSNVECKKENIDMSYRWENFERPNVGYIRNNAYNPMTFNEKENIKAVEFGASINNYDIRNEVGEAKIRETIKAEYEKWLETEEVKNFVALNGWERIDKTGEDYLNNSSYLKELFSNYGKFGSSTDFYLYDDESVKAFAKDLKEYDGDTLQYVAIMPKDDNLDAYINKLTSEKAQSIIDGLKDIKSENFKQGVITKITGQIPIFNFDYDLKLKDDLQELGIKKVFDANGGGLSDMTTREDAFIMKAIHKANIDFSNEGIKAAAVTVLSGGLGASAALQFTYNWDVPVEEIDLTFNKPFLFLIRDKASGEIWFTGTVYEPTANE